MKLDQNHIEQIKIAFEKMQTKHDLLDLMNKVKPLIYGQNSIPFDLKQLTWYANPKLRKNTYKEFKIKKKSGAERSIYAPENGLKAIQKILSLILHCVYEPNNAAMGFVRKRSIVDNAKIHVKCKYVYNLDLKDFFPSIDQARVWKCLQLRPFNLVSTIERESTSFDSYIFQMINYNLESTKTHKFHYYSKFYESGLYQIKIQDESTLIFKINTNYKYRHSNDYRVFKELIRKKHEQYNPHLIGEIIVYKDSSGYKYINELAITLHSKNKNIDIEPSSIVDVLLKDVLTKNIPLKSSTKGRSYLANMIAALCCTEMTVERKNCKTGEWEFLKCNALPQGAPTSPIISNIVCQRLDFLLSGVAKRFGLNYSRYADDISFSSMHNVYQPSNDFIKELQRIITQQNFYIKEGKTRLQKDGYRKEVTGLLVNETPNVQKRFIKQLRMWIYLWERYGYEKANSLFHKQYLADKGHVNGDTPNMKKVIWGKLQFLKMVKGKENKLLMKLIERFDSLNDSQISTNHLLKTWENQGIEKAMELYYLKLIDDGK